MSTVIQKMKYVKIDVICTCSGYQCFRKPVLMDGQMNDLRFTPFSAIFQSYQDDGRVYRFHRERESYPGPLDQRTRNPLSYRGFLICFFNSDR